MPSGDGLRLMLDCDMSSRALKRILEEAGHDVVAAAHDDELAPLDDPILFATCNEQGRIMITHNTRDFPNILREWAETGRSHHGCIISSLPTNAFGEMKKRFEQLFSQFPAQDDWVDRAIHL